MRGTVYILENPQARRVKVGMTINNAADRLSAVNDMWLKRKVTCQVCGGRRLINGRGYVPEHGSCSGGNALPLESDVALAEAHLAELRGRLSQLSGDEKGSVARIIKTLAKRIELYRDCGPIVGAWELATTFYTECAEQVELLSHEILAERLDKAAPFGEVFCCSVSEATEAVEEALRQLGLLQSARKRADFRSS